jgi:hypothetical protein
LPSEFQHGIDLINQGSYFAAHDVLEDVWRATHGWTKPFYQGMVQVAIWLHHYSTGNFVGAQSVLKKCRANLSEFPASFCGVDLAELQSQLESWQSAMAQSGPCPPPVHVRYTPPEC